MWVTENGISRNDLSNALSKVMPRVPCGYMMLLFLFVCLFHSCVQAPKGCISQCCGAAHSAFYSPNPPPQCCCCLEFVSSLMQANITSQRHIDLLHAHTKTQSWKLHSPYA